jgi:hypothetical protein
MYRDTSSNAYTNVPPRRMTERGEIKDIRTDTDIYLFDFSEYIKMLLLAE